MTLSTDRNRNVKERNCLFVCVNNFFLSIFVNLTLHACFRSTPIAKTSTSKMWVFSNISYHILINLSIKNLDPDTPLNENYYEEIPSIPSAPPEEKQESSCRGLWFLISVIIVILLGSFVYSLIIPYFREFLINFRHLLQLIRLSQLLRRLSLLERDWILLQSDNIQGEIRWSRWDLQVGTSESGINTLKRREQIVGKYGKKKRTSSSSFRVHLQAQRWRWSDNRTVLRRRDLEMDWWDSIWL